MKKLLLAAAASALMAQGAHAQTSVTLYGVVTAAVQYVNHAQNTVGGVLAPGSGSAVLMNSSGIANSRWGLRGTEDLGGGLQGVFVLENQFATENGQLAGGLMFGRQAYVGLNSRAYGKVTFGPVTLYTHWSFGERAGSVTAGSAYGAGVTYFSNGFGIGVGYDEVKTLNTAEATGASGGSDYGRDMRAAIGLSYMLGPVKLMGGYRWGNSVAPATGTPTLLPHRDDMYWAGVNWQALPALQLTLAWYYDNIKRANIGGTVVNPPNPQQYLALADYNLSKRTDLFAAVIYAHNASLNWDNIGYLPSGQSVGYLPATAQTYYKTPGSSGQLGISLGIRTIF